MPIYAKPLQTSAMKSYFQIAECSYGLCKTIANERNESHFQIAECSYGLCKGNKKKPFLSLR